MKNLTCKTSSYEFWIHTNEDGFLYFKEKNSLINAVYDIIKDDIFWTSVYHSHFIFGVDSLNHIKYVVDEERPSILLYKKLVPFVISHDILDELFVYRKNIKHKRKMGKTHKKGYSYRAMKTFPEKRSYNASKIDAAIAREYGVILKNTRNARTLPNPWDDYDYTHDNNWKNNKKKYRKQWMKKVL